MSRIITSRAAERVASWQPVAAGARLNVVVPIALRADIEKIAAQDHRTVSDLCREILECGVERRKRERLYADVARGYPGGRKLYLDLLRSYEGVDEEVRKR